MEQPHLWREPYSAGEDTIPAIEAWVNDASQPFADWYFGDPAAANAMIRKWMARSDSELYIGRALIMLDGRERPIGCVIGMSGAELSGCRSADFAAFCAALEEHPDAPELIEQTVAVARELFSPVADDEYYISRVALDRGLRGRGLGRPLLQRAIDEARARGFTRFRVDVAADNVPAIKLYRSLGMQMTRTVHNADADLAYSAMQLDAA